MSGDNTMMYVGVLACCCSVSSSSVGAFLLRGKLGMGGSDKQKVLAFYNDVLNRTRNRRFKKRIQRALRKISAMEARMAPDRASKFWAKLWSNVSKRKARVLRSAGL